jgi:hypothetical protein
MIARGRRRCRVRVEKDQPAHFFAQAPRWESCLVEEMGAVSQDACKNRYALR